MNDPTNSSSHAHDMSREEFKERLENGERPEVNKPMNAERRPGAVPLALTILVLVVFVVIIAVTVWATAHD